MGKINQIAVAIGSNKTSDLVQTREVVQTAISKLSLRDVDIAATSEFYQTPAFPIGAGPDFVNCVVLIDTAYKPLELMQILHEVEANMGRTRTNRWEQRTIDLDLLFFGDVIAPDRATFIEWEKLAMVDQLKRTPDGLILPHPRLQDRGFVLVPLNDVTSDWSHPVLGLSVKQMLDKLDQNDLADIVQI